MKALAVSLRGPTNAARHGGAQAYLLGVMVPWLEAGHQVQVICGQERVAGALLPAHETVHGLPVHRTGSPWLPLPAVVRVVRARIHAVDVVIENIGSYPLLMPWWLPPQVPLIAIRHHLEASTFIASHGLLKGSYGIALERLVEPLAYAKAVLVAPSPQTAAGLARRWLPPGHPVQVISPGAPGALGSSGRRGDGRRAKSPRPTVLYIGALDTRRKKVDHLLTAFREVSRAVPEAQLIVGGDGPERETLAKLAGGLPVRFTGFLSERDKRALLEQAWIFASPSVMEGFGITWIEANAFGLPVVGYDLGLDTVDGSCALMTEAGDRRALAASMVRLLTDARLRKIMSAAATRNAARFDWCSSSAALLSLAERVAGPRGGDVS